MHTASTLGIKCCEMQFKAVLSSACSCPGPEQDSENPLHFLGESSTLLPQTSSSLGHLARVTARRKCSWPGKLRPTPLIFQAHILPLTCHNAFSAAPKSAESALSSPSAGGGPWTLRCPAGCTLSSPKWYQTGGGSLCQEGWGRGREE